MCDQGRLSALRAWRAPQLTCLARECTEGGAGTGGTARNFTEGTVPSGLNGGTKWVMATESDQENGPGSVVGAS